VPVPLSWNEIKHRAIAFPSARVEYLFQLYEQLTAPLAPTAKPKRTRKSKN